MPRSIALVILPALCLGALAGAAAADPRQGAWTCRAGSSVQGMLVTTASSYSFVETASGRGSSGAMRWAEDLFTLQGGRLVEQGVTSGLFYADPEQPSQPVIDLYTDMGTVMTCRR